MGYWTRKLVHTSPILLILYLQRIGYTCRTAWPLAISACALFTALDIRRLCFLSTHDQTKLIAADPVLEPREMGRMSASWFYTVGIIIAMLLNLDDMTSFVLGCGMLALCDPMASVVGVRWGGKILPRRAYDMKSHEGCLGGAVVGAVWGMWFLQSFTLNTALTGFVIAALVDLVPALIDDNLLWPVASSLMWAFAAKKGWHM